MTRQNRIPAKKGSSGTIIALIPGWDMCNFREGRMATYFNVEEDCSESFTMEDVRKGDSIFLYYGDRPNSQLFLYQGFVYEKHKTDRTEIILTLDSNDPLFKVKNLLLTKKLLQSSQVFTLPLQRGDNWKLAQVWLRIWALNKDEAGVVLKDPNIGFVSNRNELAALRFMAQGLSNALSQYPTTFEEDVKLLTSEDLSPHKRLMVMFRKSEKVLISESNQWVQSKIEEIEKSQTE